VCSCTVPMYSRQSFPIKFSCVKKILSVRSSPRSTHLYSWLIWSCIPTMVPSIIIIILLQGASLYAIISPFLQTKTCNRGMKACIVWFSYYKKTSECLNFRYRSKNSFSLSVLLTGDFMINVLTDTRPVLMYFSNSFKSFASCVFLSTSPPWIFFS